MVSEAGKPVLDAELNLSQDARFLENWLLRQWQAPSGWLRGQARHDGYCDFYTETSPDELIDGGSVGGSTGSMGGSVGSVGTSIGDPEDLIGPDGTLINSFVLPKLVAHVAGRPVVVEYTNTGIPGWNIVELAEATLYDGTNATVKRTDFVFLEVWKALVAPSPRAGGYIQVVSNADVTAGDVLTINGVPLTAVVGPAGVDEFEIGVDEAVTASYNFV